MRRRQDFLQRECAAGRPCLRKCAAGKIFLTESWWVLCPVDVVYKSLFTNHRSEFSFFKGGPELLEKEIHEILGSKREDRFLDPFFGSGTKYQFGLFFRTCFASAISKAPRDMQKFPHKCQKIARCWERAVYGSRSPIASHLAHPLRNDKVSRGSTWKKVGRMRLILSHSASGGSQKP